MSTPNLDLGPEDRWDVVLPALTIKEPWLELILSGYKAAEYRSWKPNGFPRVVLLCAGKTLDCETMEALGDEAVAGLAGVEVARRATKYLGCARALCVFDRAHKERGWDNFAWEIHTVTPLASPFRVRGQQGFFKVAATHAQLAPDLYNTIAYKRTEDTVNLPIGRIAVFHHAGKQLIADALCWV